MTVQRLALPWQQSYGNGADEVISCICRSLEDCFCAQPAGRRRAGPRHGQNSNEWIGCAVCVTTITTTTTTQVVQSATTNSRNESAAPAGAHFVATHESN